MSVSFNKENHLSNNCQSEKLAKCAVAAWAHEATTATQMFYADENHYTIEAGVEHLLNYQGQEVLFLEFKAYSATDNFRSIAIIYEKEDLVMLCTEFSLGDDDNEYFEPGYPMTTASFFSYLNSLPNLKRHVLPSSLDNETKLGLALMDELSNQ
ncbi:TPA: hypothetical protein RTK63_004366 [Vibrio harveyi]|nr:hypothetical protein [Vibrio harveyi]